MNYLDYREALGIGFNDEEKLKCLKTQCLNAVRIFENDEYVTDDFFCFCNAVNKEFSYGCESFEDALDILETFHGVAFLFSFVAFINTLNCDLEMQQKFKNELLHILDNCKIKYQIKTDEDGIFIIPKGAKELDDALVSEPLEWLKEYPKAYTTFSRTLRQYSNGEYVRDVADNFRKALEDFFQEFLGNNKNLANNKTEICQFLGSNNAESEIASLMQNLLNSYEKLNNGAAKHKDKLDPKYLEFLMYQTGLFIRMIITVGKED